MNETPVAILADVHLHDTFADFGAGVLIGGRRRALRSWQDTATGARALNESGAALCAALAAVRARGIRQVVLLGDYTDDGQVATTAGLAAILHDQAARHGLRFHAIPGNHDVWGPHGKHVSTRLATGPATTALVTSDPALAAEPGAVFSPGMRCAGQPEGLAPMAAFGLFRQPWHLHWESPFGASDRPGDRTYLAQSDDGSVTRTLFDASYLVEPEAGLWLLLLDANVFRPRNGIADPRRKRAFHDPSTAGWNAVLTQKPHLWTWIADVHDRAAAQGKRLLVFSHYPAADPFDDDGSERALFGDSDVAQRTPCPEVAQRLAAAGVRRHYGGHIHAHAVTRAGGLTNVAVPSTCAFPPGFVIAAGDGAETVSLASVPRDRDLIAFYRAAGAEGPMAEAPDLGSFLWHQIRARTLAHHLPRLFPAGLPDLPDAAGRIADWYAIRQGGSLARAHVDAQAMAAWRGLLAGADPAGDPADATGRRRRFLAMADRAIRRMQDQAT